MRSRRVEDAGGLHVFVGTKAQYIKTAPLLRRMDRQGVEYRLIDSGQHAELSPRLRDDLGVREPDAVFAGAGDVESIYQALAWTARLGRHALRPRSAVVSDVFGGKKGICVVHGDTPTTLITTLLAIRAGLKVAHLESGLRSHDLLHPFPEEIIRIAVMKMADLLFAPHQEARDNLDEMSVRGRVVALPANTTVEALRHSLGDLSAPGDGPVLVTCHRVENLTRRGRLRRLVELVTEIARRKPVEFVTHGPTERALRSAGLEEVLLDSGVEVRPLMRHREFARRLARAQLVITDGGSIQEECYYLGIPTLLWRKTSERPEGLGRNVVVSKYDDKRIREFLDSFEAYRCPPLGGELEPSREILDRLLEELTDPASRP